MNQPAERLKTVSRTLFLTLQARAYESSQPNGLFVDSEAVGILQAITRRQAELPLDWITRVGIVARTDIIDVQARNYLSSARPPFVVNLGAGLCTRYYRLGRPAVDWIEIDLPEVNELRRAVLPESCPHRMIASSVTDHNWIDQISCSPEAHPLFIAEGLLMYLRRSEVMELLIALQRRFPGCKLLADTVSPLLSAIYARHPTLGNVGFRFHRGIIGSQRQLNRWNNGIAFEDEWFLSDHHPERWGRIAPLRHIPWIRSLAKVVLLALS
jgi:O-methyltransferase involved in polyketide biosynthesis